MRGGADAYLHKRPARDEDDPDAADGHKLIPVYGEMLLQICADYPGLPDPRTLTMAEIRFFYEGLRASLKKSTQPRPQKKR